MSKAPAGFPEALHALIEQWEDGNYPLFYEDREACMKRTREFLDARDALFARFGVTIEDVRKGFQE